MAIYGSTDTRTNALPGPSQGESAAIREPSACDQVLETIAALRQAISFMDTLLQRDTGPSVAASEPGLFEGVRIASLLASSLVGDIKTLGERLGRT